MNNILLQINTIIFFGMQIEENPNAVLQTYVWAFSLIVCISATFGAFAFPLKLWLWQCWCALQPLRFCNCCKTMHIICNRCNVADHRFILGCKASIACSDSIPTLPLRRTWYRKKFSLNFVHFMTCNFQ